MDPDIGLPPQVTEWIEIAFIISSSHQRCDGPPP